MGRGGFGSRGEVQYTTENTETRVLIPWRIWVRQSLVWDIILLVTVYVPGTVIWIKAACFWSWWRFVSGWGMLSFWPLAIPWIVFGKRLVHHNYRPKIFHDSWPPPMAQSPVTETGALTWDNADDLLPPELTKKCIVHEFAGQYTERSGRVVLLGVETEEPEKLQRFCRDVLKGKVNFSGRAATDYEVAKEYGKLLSRLTELHLIRGTGPRETPELREAGKWFLEDVATTPLPRRPAGIWERIMGRRQQQSAPDLLQESS